MRFHGTSVEVFRQLRERVATWTGMVYVAFIFDVFSRMIVGWRASTRITTELVLDTLEMTMFNRRRRGVDSLAGLIHHTDAGANTPPSPSPAG